MTTFHPTSLFDKIFEGGILLKGATGALEFLGGLLLLFVSPATMHNFVAFVTQRELLDDPHDKIANLLVIVPNTLAPVVRPSSSSICGSMRPSSSSR